MSFFLYPWYAFRRGVVHLFTRLLTQPLHNYTCRSDNNLDALKRYLRKGDVVLVEGSERISEVIKYLTQSSWSHSAIYIGDELTQSAHPLAASYRERYGEEADFLLIEALVEEGVVASPISKYLHYNIRVCRPHNLRKEHLRAILDEVIQQLGYKYDLKNILDLARYFLPVSLIPRRFRQTALQFGSGEPTQVICSSMLAAAFGRVGFPIVPLPATSALQPVVSRQSRWRRSLAAFSRAAAPRVFRQQHPTLITPRDFDLSPYFEIVKFNVIESGRFDYRTIVWAEDPG
jgi:hypothetical protein